MGKKFLLTRLACVVAVIAALCAPAALGGGAAPPHRNGVPRTWRAAAQHISPRIRDTITNVHVVYMNHLDVGFTDTAYNVVNTYFDKHFPKALRTAEEVHLLPFHETFIYTTHPWLVSLYLDCPPGGKLHCPSEADRDRFVNGIRKGYISWQGFPFNAEPELFTPSFFDAALAVGADLARTFNVSAPVTMSQRDVPGLTRSVIPLLVKRGIQFVTIGVNSASAPPYARGVDPNGVFLWRDPGSGTDVMAAVHPDGYGGIDTKDVVVVPGLAHALAVDFKSDNRGPQNALEVVENLHHLRKEFPNADVRASTFDAFVAQLLPLRASLPVSEDEMGDTWIYGCASDPFKHAALREMMRTLDECVAAGKCDMSDEPVKNFARYALKLGEHTWGLSIGGYLKDWGNWSNAQFESVRHNENYLQCETEWRAQRSFIDGGIDALAQTPARLAGRGERGTAGRGRHPRLGKMVVGPDVSEHPRRHRVPVSRDAAQPIRAHGDNPYADLAVEMRKRVDALRSAQKPDLTGFTPVQVGTPIRLSDRFTRVVISNCTGALTGLYDAEAQRDWASSTHPLGRFIYQTLNSTDFDTWVCRRYSYVAPQCWSDFDKPGIEKANPPPQSRVWDPESVHAWIDAAHNTILVRLVMPTEPVTYSGAPADVWLRYTASQAAGSPPLLLTMSWFNKTSTRLPEALWLQFHPVVSGPWDVAREGLSRTQFGWRMDKLGSPVDPEGPLMPNGSWHLHGVGDGGVWYTPPQEGAAAGAGASPLCGVRSYDAGLVSPGAPFVLPGNWNPPTMTEGFAYNLYNNAWGTNYIMWYPFTGTSADARFRFALDFQGAV